MNFLAHFFLARESAEMMVGNFLADFVRGRVEKHPEKYRRGIRLHRTVDAFTDSHGAVHRCVARVSGPLGHYAPVAVDVIFDHFLARDFQSFSAEPLEDFAQRVYSVLRAHASDFPPEGVRLARYMSDQDWLSSYREVDGIRTALMRMSRRVKHPVRLEDSIDPMLREYDAFDAEFREVFGELQSLVVGL